MKEYRQRLIKYGYPTKMVNKWTDGYCKFEFDIYMKFMKDNNLSTSFNKA